MNLNVCEMGCELYSRSKRESQGEGRGLGSGGQRYENTKREMSEVPTIRQVETGELL